MEVWGGWALVAVATGSLPFAPTLCFVRLLCSAVSAQSAFPPSACLNIPVCSLRSSFTHGWSGKGAGEDERTGSGRGPHVALRCKASHATAEIFFANLTHSILHTDTVSCWMPNECWFLTTGVRGNTSRVACHSTHSPFVSVRVTFCPGIQTTVSLQPLRQSRAFM